jgi:uncharacterized protein (TIGR00255 family)
MSETARLRSMTGFATREGAAGGLAWTWTLRSVNGKSLDLKLRLPPGFEAAEPAIRRMRTPLRRGNVTASMRLDRTEAATSLRLDEDALAAVLKAGVRAQTLAKEAGLKTAKLRVESLLALGGALRAGQDGEVPGEAAIEAAAYSFREAAEALGEAREAEGAALASVLSGQLDEIESLTRDAARLSGEAVPHLRDRLRAQVQDLLSGELPEDRVAQEAALLAVKADVREETDRLLAHVASARLLLRDEDAVGRKLEFLAQELAREASTLTTKAPTVELKRTGLALRHVIDQLREQVLNVE